MRAAPRSPIAKAGTSARVALQLRRGVVTHRGNPRKRLDGRMTEELTGQRAAEWRKSQRQTGHAGEVSGRQRLRGRRNRHRHTHRHRRTRCARKPMQNVGFLNLHGARKCGKWEELYKVLHDESMMVYAVAETHLIGDRRATDPPSLALVRAETALQMAAKAAVSGCYGGPVPHGPGSTVHAVNTCGRLVTSWVSQSCLG
ncbi:hypothetical protein HPB48_025139 [Haemaphysalis longicornis]|uniref:Uncharacterized protein n=1 Tax=Haemaphysalis longicornis TaxID=44386 RepID=A0A9J6H7A3_HAELO|nr:hypothetical protein HPB48_025139 [Haemaphysalis longicornis]